LGETVSHSPNPSTSTPESVTPRLTGAQRRAQFWGRVKQDRAVLLLALPGSIIFVLFAYLPLLGNVIAFQDYLPFIGIAESPFVGFANFAQLGNDPAFWNAVKNTIVITAVQLVFFFPLPIALALLIHSIMSERLRRFVQSVVYLPHFISWVIIVALFQQMLGETGPGGQFFAAIGQEQFRPLSDPDFFKWLVTIQMIWKDAGWAAIIFLAALLSIDDTLYEAAAMDGAGRWQRLWHITLPGIMPVIVVLLILRLGTALSVGFEQILLQRDAVGPQAAEVLDTYVYFQGVIGGQWGVSAAAGLIKGIVGTLIVIAANSLAKRMGHRGMYSV
jgi:putative aldouronate transport system permease protein